MIRYGLDIAGSRLQLAQLPLAAGKPPVDLQPMCAQVNPSFLFIAFNSILAGADNSRAGTTLTGGMGGLQAGAVPDASESTEREARR